MAAPPRRRAAALITWALSSSACGAGGYIYSPQVTSSDPTTQSAPSPAPTGSTDSTDSTGSTGSTGTTTGGGAAAGSGAGTTNPGTVTRTCATTTDTFANFASAEFDKSCNSCHGGEWDTVAQASAKAASLRGQIASGAMPTTGQLDSTIKQRLLTWLNCPTPLP